MSTRWTPSAPSDSDPTPTNRSWKKFLLPGAGVAVVLLMVLMVAAILATGGDEEDQDQDTVAVGADATETAVAEDDDLTATPEATPETTATPSQEDDDDDEETDLTPTPEPTPTIDPAAEESELVDPTPEPEPAEEETEPEPEPEAPPATGDFGELPPGDMPSGSPADAMSLQYSLDMGMEAVPSEAAVYQLQPPQWTHEAAQNAAARLGIDAEVVDQGGGSFSAEGSTGSIYINPASTQYVRAASGEGAPALPGNDQLVQMAQTWLSDSGLVGTGIGTGQVIDRDEGSGRATVSIKPAEPGGIISATPSARVTLRGDGIVTESHISWPGSLSASTYGLRSAENLWADASQGRGYVEINYNDLPANFQGAGGTVSITSASVVYTVAGSPEGAQYLVPVVVFSGSASIEGAGNGVPVQIYVQAAAAQAIPRG